MKKKLRNNLGITLIALIITIIVILILVAVTVRVAINSGLFGHAGNATNQWADAQRQESLIGNDNNIQDTVNKYISGEDKNPVKHPDQGAENTDIGIDEDGNPVNLDLWKYYLNDEQTYVLGDEGTWLSGGVLLGGTRGYIGPISENGEITGSIPKYIINADTGISIPVTTLKGTFYELNIAVLPAIPNTITSLSGTFSSCGSLTSINIPDSVTSIGDFTFFECTSLTSINIPNSVTSVGVGAFSHCTELASVNIPNSVTSVGSEAFSHCTGLTSINIPSSVTNMGISVFSNWTASQIINCQATEKPAGWEEGRYNWNAGCNATINWGVSM